MRSIFEAEKIKGGVITNVFAHIYPSKAFSNNREISREELIRLNEITMEKKKRLRSVSKKI